MLITRLTNCNVLLKIFIADIQYTQQILTGALIPYILMLDIRTKFKLCKKEGRILLYRLKFQRI